jgi:hypothetical protein
LTSSRPSCGTIASFNRLRHGELTPAQSPAFLETGADALAGGALRRLADRAGNGDFERASSGLRQQGGA